jgi:flagellar biosynthesis/type III secretory pathway chaperone
MRARRVPWPQQRNYVDKTGEMAMNMMNRGAPQQPNLQTERVVTPPLGAMRAAAGQAPSNQAQRQVPVTANASRGDDLLNVVRQLSDVLTKENLALKRHKTSEVRALGERKEQLARLYQQHMNAIHRDPDAVKTWDPAKKAALTQASIRLSELMSENASLLKANISTINKFLKSVVEAVKEKQEKLSASYSKQGALSGYTAVKRNLAVSFNQTM